MAPEVKSAAPQSTAADMWSLGVTLWQLVAGALPGWAKREGGHGGELALPEGCFSEVGEQTAGGVMGGWMMQHAADRSVAGYWLQA